MSDQQALLAQAAIDRLIESGDFDAQWYVERYPDVALSTMSPAEHYVRVGQLLGRQPTAAATAPGKQPTTHRAAASTLRRRPLPDQATRQAIMASGLFDATFYRARTTAILNDDVQALDHYCHCEDDWNTPPPSALFSSPSYARTNPDIGRASPLAHAALHGLNEGRPVFDPELVDAFLDRHATTATTPLADVIDFSRPAVIFCWDRGNFFFSEIADYLLVLLARLGVSARRATANEIPASGVTPIIVAPHEFCVLGEGRGWSQQVLARSVPLNTEQWHTGWFTDALRFLRKAGRGLDINPTSASGLNAWGLPVAFLPLVELEGSPYAIEQAPLSPDFAAARAIEPLTYPQNAAERAYDLLFIGASNQRRAQALGNLAPVLSDRTTFLHCPQFNGPAREGDPDAMTTADAVQLARNARLLLNLHQGESRYFEWHRIYLLGIARGCVVLSEPCLANAWVIEGTHYIGCEADAMGEQIEWLLGTDEGAARCAQIAANCAELVARLTDIKAWLS